MKRKYLWTPCLLALALGATASPHARAQAPAAALGKTPGDGADELVRRGNVLANQDKWTAALSLFQEAWRLKQSYDIAGNLGIAEHATGAFCDAAEHLTFALSGFPVSGKPAHRALLEKTLAGAVSEVAELRLMIAMDGADVRVDGVRIGTTPLTRPVFVTPGEHTIDVTIKGFLPSGQTVTVEKGTSREVEVMLLVDLPPRPKSGTPVVPQAVSERPLWPAAIGGGAAVLLLTVGIVATVAANGEASDAETLRADLNASGKRCGLGGSAQACGDLMSAASSQNSFRDVAVVSLIGTGAAALVGGGLLAWALTEPDSTVRGSVRATPSVGPHGAGLLIGGSF